MLFGAYTVPGDSLPLLVKNSIRILSQEFGRGIILCVYWKVANVHVTGKLYAYSASDSIRIEPINFTVSSPVLCA